MKKSYIFTFILFALMSSGCEQNDLKYFEEETPFLNIWLGTNTIVQDNVTHNFAYSPTDRDAITFNYRIAGDIVDYDRSFELATADPDARLLNFTFGSYKVPAGQREGSFTLYVDKPVDEDVLEVFKNKDLKVNFTVKHTDLFQASPKDYSELKLTFKNAVTKPDNWDIAVAPYRALVEFFGDYSDKKYEFVIQTTGLSNFSVFRTVVVNPELPENTITELHAVALKNQCRIALEQRNLEHGEDLLDEKGFPIVFPR
jgi:hypothetical protein